MSKDVTKRDLGNYIAGAIIVILIGVALIVYSVPNKQVYAGFSTTVTFTRVSIQTDIITSTNAVISTVVSTQTFTSTLVTPSISTITNTVTSAAVTVTQTTTGIVTQTIAQTFPASIMVSGSASSSAPLSTPTSIDFVSGASSQKATITNGHYSISLQNKQSYQVSIGYSLPLSGGACKAGTLVLNAVADVSQAWGC